MGCYTRYEVSARATDSVPDTDLREPYTIIHEANGICEYIDYDDECKWYDYQQDMKDVSLRFPGWLFTVHGEGEEAGDIWQAYFLDGRMAYHKMPQWEPPEFNEDDLK